VCVCYVCLVCVCGVCGCLIDSVYVVCCRFGVCVCV